MYVLLLAVSPVMLSNMIFPLLMSRCFDGRLLALQKPYLWIVLITGHQIHRPLSVEIELDRFILQWFGGTLRCHLGNNNYSWESSTTTSKTSQLWITTCDWIFWRDSHYLRISLCYRRRPISNFIFSTSILLKLHNEPILYLLRSFRLRKVWMFSLWEVTIQSWTNNDDSYTIFRDGKKINTPV